MNFGEAIKSGFDNYVTFSGRAARSEFWYWILFSALAELGGEHHRPRLRDRSYWCRCSDILGAAASRGRRLGAAPARS